MVEVALDRGAHRLFKTPAAGRRVAAFAEVRKIAEQQNAERVGPIKQQRIVDFDVHAQEVEPDALRVCDVVFQQLHIARGVDAIRKVGLIQRAADVDRLAIQDERRWRADISSRLSRQAAHPEVAVHHIRNWLAIECEPDRIELRVDGVPQHHVR